MCIHFRISNGTTAASVPLMNHKVKLLGSLYTVSQKTVQNCFLSELLQISTNFDNFWQKDGK